MPINPLFVRQPSVWDYLLPFAGRFSLMKMQQNFQQKQAETDKTWREGQAAEARQFQSGESEKGRQFQATQQQARQKPQPISFGGKDYLALGSNIVGPRYSAEYDEKGNYIQTDALSGKQSVLVNAPKPTGGFKIGGAKEMLIQKIMGGGKLNPSERRALDLISGKEREVFTGVIRMASNDREYLSEIDPIEKSKKLREIENTVRGLYGGRRERVPLETKTNPQVQNALAQKLVGRPAGKYRDPELGVTLHWDGSQIRRIEEDLEKQDYSSRRPMLNIQ